MQMQTIKLNKKFKVGQKVVCTNGSFKGKEYTIELLLQNSYSCKPVENFTGNYAEFDDRNLELA